MNHELISSCNIGGEEHQGAQILAFPRKKETDPFLLTWNDYLEDQLKNVIKVGDDAYDPYLAHEDLSLKTVEVPFRGKVEIISAKDYYGNFYSFLERAGIDMRMVNFHTRSSGKPLTYNTIVFPSTEDPRLEIEGRVFYNEGGEPETIDWYAARTKILQLSPNSENIVSIWDKRSRR